jgi:small GTP-binding protein
MSAKPIINLPPVKITFIGDASVGKTSIVSRIVREDFSEHTSSTIGAAFSSIKYSLYRGGQERTYHVWDTAGQERYYSLIPLYLSGAQVIVIVYDITNRDSYTKVTSNWLPYIRKNLRLQDDEPMPMLYLIGNKIDLVDKMKKPRQVTIAEAAEFAKEHDMGFLEVSAKTGTNAKEVFRQIAIHVDNLLLQQAGTIQNERNTVNLDVDCNASRIGSCWGSVVSRIWW